MKKLFILSAFLLCFSMTYAQLSVGAKAGLNFANCEVEGTFAPDTDSRTTFHIGGFAEYAITESLYIRPELLISGKGLKLELGNTTYKSSPTYLDIPVLVGYKANLGAVTVFGQAGPYFGIALGGKKVEDDGSEKTTEDIKFGDDSNSDLKRGDFGLNFGAGVEFNPGVQVSLNYGLGLSDIYPTSEEGSSKNRVFSLSVGYRFAL